MLVENGGTVVIGGIYTQDERTTTNKVPVLGDLPYVGFLFKQNLKLDNRSELLIFITPRIIKDGADAAPVAGAPYGNRGGRRSGPPFLSPCPRTLRSTTAFR